MCTGYIGLKVHHTKTGDAKDPTTLLSSLGKLFTAILETRI